MEIKKKQYTKPQLRTIELKAEEVLAGGCKTNLFTGPGGSTCIAIPCSGNGS